MIKFDRRYIYLITLLVIAIPKIFGITLPSPRMKTAETAFSLIENTKVEDSKSGSSPKKAALVILDFGPNTVGENRPSSSVIIEHLFRKKIPVILYSQYPLSKDLLESIPGDIAKRLNKEKLNYSWVYGKDWVNIGYRPGDVITMQSIASSADFRSFLKSDVRGNFLKDLPMMKDIFTFKHISHVVEITGLTGTLDKVLEYLQSPQHKPIYIHGCTSVVIPEAFIYLDSGQLKGLIEGINGAAWYSKLLKEKYQIKGEDELAILNTMISFAHLIVIAFILLGNMSLFFKKKQV
jgi:hypothetical protein